MNSFLRSGLAVDHLARIASKRELDAAELDRRRVVEQVLHVRRCLKRRVANLEKDLDEAGSAVDRRLDAVCEQAVCLGGRVDAMEQGVLAEFGRRLDLLEAGGRGSCGVCDGMQQQQYHSYLISQVETLQATLQARDAELARMRGEFLALEEAHTQLKGAVAAARSIEELGWVQISGM